METKKKIVWVISIVAVLLVVAAVVVYPKLVVTLPKDGADAETDTFTAVRGQRYTEMFLIGGNAITKDLSANVYNTTGLNGGATTGDSCPASAILDKVDSKAEGPVPRARLRSRTVPACGRWTGLKSRWVTSWTSAA